jgi:UDP-N-acetylglucosamine:LPS N-acetylglucosamine transferase
MKKRKKILAVASGGGHWIQLLRLRPALEDHEVIYVSVVASYGSDVKPDSFHLVNDATRWNKLGLILLALRILAIVLRERPDIVLSTGAAPGYFALRFGKLFGAKTLWIDSAANAEELSMSGRLAGKHADLWLTQWPDLAQPDGPAYRGRVI